MPRKKRLWVPGVGAHTISRFVDRRFFLRGDQDRLTFLAAIGRADPRWDWQWLSYALMSSHLHYGHIAGLDDPDRFYSSAHTSFAVRFHRGQEGRTLGPVFAERPTIHPIRKQERLRIMVAYHHRNPPESGVVARPRDSRWSSHRVYLRLDPEPAWLDVERALALLGFSDTAAGRERFDDFVMSIDFEAAERLCGPTPERIECVVRTGPKVVDWQRLEELARMTMALPAGVPIQSRRRVVVRTRWLIARVATRHLGQSYAAVAKALGVTRGAVWNLLQRTPPSNELERAEATLRECLGL
ncbi:MAG: hypothetical protein JJ863_05595 [Deltaproteobacteria bacterium]|nr:hypothetical protein [Deltaproteobacteria bacterium]